MSDEKGQIEDGGLTAADVMEITNVIHKAMHSLDQGDGAAFQSLFLDDESSVLVTTAQATIKKPDLAEFYRGLHLRFVDFQHFESNIVLAYLGRDAITGAKSARNDSYWHSIGISGPAAGRIGAVGTHSDILKQSPSGWKLSSRLIRHSWSLPAN